MSEGFPPDRPRSPATLTVPLSALYGIGNHIHRRWCALRGANRLKCPVISVGNLTVGGTGKTPLVIELCRLLIAEFPAFRSEGAVAILSRGYGRKSQALVNVQVDTPWDLCGDEPLLIKRAIPEAAVIVHSSRFEAGRFALQKYASQVCLLDDGFQHYALARNLDLIVMPAANPLGNGRLLPAGPLREPVSALGRAHGLISVGSVHAQSESLAKRFGIPLIRAHAELEFNEEIRQLAGRKCALLTGIAAPSRIHQMLSAAGISLTDHCVFPDHHAYSPSDLAEVESRARISGAEAILTTAKDRVRIIRWEGQLPILTVGMRLIIDDCTSILDLFAKHVFTW